MLRGIASRLSYANVVATVALFIALGGGAYAAFKVPKNSVGTKQLKNGAVTGAKVANGSLTGTQINAGTLGTVPSASNASNAGALGGTPASGFLHGSGSAHAFIQTALPGGSAQLGGTAGTLTGTCDNPCMNPSMTYHNTSGVTQLIEFADAYGSGYQFYTISAGATQSQQVQPTASSGLGGTGVYVDNASGTPLEQYWGQFVQWSSSGATYNGEFLSEG